MDAIIAEIELHMDKILGLLDELKSTSPAPTPDPEPEEEYKTLKGYKYEASDHTDHVGEYYVMPPAKLKGKIQRITVGSTLFRYVYDWGEFELWYGPPTSGIIAITLYDGTVYKSEYETVDSPPDPTPGEETGMTKEVAVYAGGDANGGMDYFYFSKHMSQYPSTFYLTVKGCLVRTVVANNGSRWDNGKGCILKQSEVAGRKMGLLLTVCKSENAWIEY